MGYTIWPDGPVGEALADIHKERARQEQLRREGKFLWTCSDPTVNNAKKLAVLAEEFGEASREVVEELIASDKSAKSLLDLTAKALLDLTGRVHDEEAKAARERLRKELVQVAAVCVAWLESLS
jgi:hypothetical protein